MLVNSYVTYLKIYVLFTFPLKTPTYYYFSYSLNKIGRKLMGDHEASSSLIHDKIAIIIGCKY